MDKDFKDRVVTPARSNQAPPVWLWFLTGLLAGAFSTGLICLKTGGFGATGVSPQTVAQPQGAPHSAGSDSVSIKPALPPQVGPVAQPSGKGTKPSVAKPTPSPAGPVNPANPPTEAKVATSSTPSAPAKPASEAEPTQPQAPEPRYEFYTILSEKEEVVNNREQVQVPSGDQAGPATDPQPESTEPLPQLSAPASGEPQYMLQLGSFQNIEDAQRRRAEFALMGLLCEIQTVTIRDGVRYHRVRSGPYSSVDVGVLAERLQARNISSLPIRLKD